MGSMRNRLSTAVTRSLMVVLRHIGNPRMTTAAFVVLFLMLPGCYETEIVKERHRYVMTDDEYETTKMCRTNRVSGETCCWPIGNPAAKECSR